MGDKIRPINGRGDGEPVRECQWCLADVRGRRTRLMLGVKRLWVCDACYEDRPPVDVGDVPFVTGPITLATTGKYEYRHKYRVEQDLPGTPWSTW